MSSIADDAQAIMEDVRTGRIHEAVNIASLGGTSLSAAPRLPRCLFFFFAGHPLSLFRTPPAMNSGLRRATTLPLATRPKSGRSEVRGVVRRSPELVAGGARNRRRG